MSDKNVVLSRDEGLQLIAEAKELIPFYVESGYYPASAAHEKKTVDQLALRLYERKNGVFTVGMTFHKDKVNLHIVSCEYIFSEAPSSFNGHTATVCIEDMGRTSMSCLASSIADLLKDRKLHGSQEIKSHMMSINYDKELAKVSSFLEKYR